MNFEIITPQNLDIAQAIEDIITPYSIDGSMIDVKADQIQANAEEWRCFVEAGKICGFFHARSGNDKFFLEMGSVVSKRPGFLTIMLTEFQTMLQTQNILCGFAVTKHMDTAEKFQNITNGRISQVSHRLFQRSENDRYFIYWPVEAKQRNATIP